MVYSLCTNTCQITILTFQHNFLLIHFTLSENFADDRRKFRALYGKKRDFEDHVTGQGCRCSSLQSLTGFIFSTKSLYLVFTNSNPSFNNPNPSF